MQDIVVGMGEALWDVLPEGKKIGGAPANFAYHVSQFGLPGYVVSAVGDDALGKEIVENFTSKGLNQLIAEVPYPTGTVQVEIDQAGIPQYDIKENVAWDNIPYTDSLEALARKTKAVCFGSLAQRNVVSRDTINRFLDAMPQSDDSLVVFDVNLRQGFYNKEILCNSMSRCNILKINDEELVTVSRMFGYPGLAGQCGVPAHAEGGGGRYRRGRRQLYRRVHSVDTEGQERTGGSLTRCADLGLRLHQEGRHAHTARRIDRLRLCLYKILRQGRTVGFEL